MIKGVKIIRQFGRNNRVTEFTYKDYHGGCLTDDFNKMTIDDFEKMADEGHEWQIKCNEAVKRIEAQRASMTPEERAGWDEADRAVFERWMRRTPTPFLTDASLKEKTRISILSDESCELLSNFVSLTDCKQPRTLAVAITLSCELLSNFVSLTDCKQLRHERH